MLGFGQASGMGTTFNYPTRYSADYTRYAQSGQQFNQPVMGYNTYGQIFAPPPRRQPPPIMGGKGGGMGYRPPPPPTMGGKGGGMGDMQYRGPQQPPTIGGKGGQGFQSFDPTPRIPRQPNNSEFRSYPGGSGYGPRPFREGIRTQQLGLNNEISPRQQGTYYSTGPRDEYAIGPTPDLRDISSQDGDGRSYTQALIPATQDGVSGYYTDGSQRNFVPYSYSSAVDPARTMNFNNPFQQQQQMLQNQALQNAGNQPALAPGLSAFNQGQMPMFDNNAFRNFNFGQGFGRMSFQEGGQVPPDAATNMEMMLSEAGPANPQAEMSGEYDRLIQMTMQAVLGQVEQPDEIIQMFIEEFGVDAFRQLREAVLKQQVPNAQTEGMVDGNGGGMDDQVMGMIGNQRPVAVSPGEYIVPADVVSGLGDGSSKSGADILDELNQAVRMARTGTPEQPRPLMETLQQ
jgi:hypothetical protein